MGAERVTSERHWAWAACAVAVAAAVGSTPANAKSESRAIEQIERYCAVSWRNAGIDHQDWPDCTQEALLDLLQRVTRGRLSTAITDAGSGERRELNRSVWRTAQRWRRRPRCLPFQETINQSDGTASESDDTSLAWNEVLAVSRDCLSQRQQQILQLTRDGWRVSEIAEELQLTPARISDEKYKAVCKLRDRLVA